MALIRYEDHRDTILHVDLEAPAHSRWLETVEKIGDDVHDLMEDVVDLCQEQWGLHALPPLIRPIAKAAVAGTTMLGGRLAGIIATIYGQTYSAEVRSIAKATGVSFPQLLLGNLMYDLTQYLANRAAACSSYSFNLANKYPVLARNMDWDLPGTIGTHTVMVHFHRKSHSYVSVGVAGMVGILSAMRPGYWAVTLNQAPIGKLGFRWHAMPALQQLRNACDEFGKYRTLVRRINEYQTMSPFFAHVVGTEPKQHVVVNGFGAEYSERVIDGTCLIQTNHFVEPEYRELNDPDEWLDEHGDIWVSNSKPRYRSLTRRLSRLPTSLETSLKLLAREPVTNERTMQSMAFCPASGEARLKVRA